MMKDEIKIENLLHTIFVIIKTSFNEEASVIINKIIKKVN